MSGGVDSSVAAALLKEQGYDVLGVTMHVWADFGINSAQQRQRSCCAPYHIEDAARVAKKLGIRHELLDFRPEFDRQVVDYFCREYLAGRTPNPCIPCNQKLKFGVLLSKMRELGVEYIATGHYARIEQDDEGRFLLKRARDKSKDQSYFLFNLSQKQLKHILFPLGDLTKERTRKIARSLGLKVAEKPDSQEICFIDQHYEQLLRKRFPQKIKPGAILDSKGQQVGVHPGAPLYTIGQRRGLGIALGYPLYVTHIDSAANTITVGCAEELYHDRLVAARCHMVSGEELTHSRMVKAKIRSGRAAAKAIISLLGHRKIQVRFAHPQRAITPGQAVVFYEGDTVLGGGWIEA
jgi:tRNA-specific 2-thiouridylase